MILSSLVVWYLGSVAAVAPPGQLYDLSSLTLQLPVDNGKGSILQIQQPALATYTSSYFHTDANDLTIVMWAPEDGLVTSNGAGPRTELTEPNGYFTFSGVHTMQFTQQVLSADPSGRLCIGQVKGDSYSTGNLTIYDDLYGNSTSDTTMNSTLGSDSGASCLIVVEYIYNVDKQQAEAHFRDNFCNSVIESLGSYAVGEKIRTTFQVNGYKVYVSSNKVTLPAYDYSFWKGANYRMHFKVGVYDQGSGKDHSKGGRSKLSQLKITHQF